MMDYADSTIAMSLYNLLAVAGGSHTLEALVARLDASQHVGLGVAQATRAAAHLRDRGLVAEDDEGRLSVRDPARRVIVERDRSDAGYDEDTGNPIGGWNGWRIRDPQRGLVPVEEVI